MARIAQWLAPHAGSFVIGVLSNMTWSWISAKSSGAAASSGAKIMIQEAVPAWLLYAAGGIGAVACYMLLGGVFRWRLHNAMKAAPRPSTPQPPVASRLPPTFHAGWSNASLTFERSENKLYLHVDIGVFACSDAAVQFHAPMSTNTAARLGDGTKIKEMKLYGVDGQGACSLSPRQETPVRLSGEVPSGRVMVLRDWVQTRTCIPVEVYPGVVQLLADGLYPLDLSRLAGHIDVSTENATSKQNLDEYAAANPRGFGHG